jgi:hypothetical protein
MTERLGQRYCIKFCQKLGDTQQKQSAKFSRLSVMMQWGITQIKEWVNCFKEGCMSADCDHCSGRQKSQNADVIDRVRTLIMEDRPGNG